MTEIEDGIQETNSGIRVKGNIDDIVAFSKRFEKFMENEDLGEDCSRNFKDWRPEKEDSEKDIEKRTAEHASIPKTEVESKSRGFSGDIKESKEEMKKAASKAKDSGDATEAGWSLIKAIEDFFRPFISSFFSLTRKTEEEIYSKLMLKFNSYYFDTREISICLDKKDGGYIISINSPIEEYRKLLKEKLVECEDR